MHFSSISYRQFLTTAVCTILVGALSCKREVDNSISPPRANQSDPILYQRLLDRGFKAEDIKDLGDHFVVEGDIRFWKQSTASPGARLAHRVEDEAPVVSLANVATIKVAVDQNSFTTSQWRTKVVNATQLAISSWNALPNSKVNFIYTTDLDQANITVQRNTSLPANVYGQTDGPAGCNVEAELDLNDNSANLTEDQLHRLIAHELCHPLGFTHTDGQGDRDIVSRYIPTTLVSDPNSVFNSGIYDGITSNTATVKTWSGPPTGFSSGDQAAISYTFPDTPTATAYLEGTKVGARWTFSYFCEPTVHIIFYAGSTKIIEADFVNDGQHQVQSPTITSQTIYRVIVSSIQTPSKTPLQAQVYNP